MSKQRRNNKEAQEFIARLKAEPGFYSQYYETIPEGLLKHFDQDKQTGATLQVIKNQLPELESGLKQVLSEIRGVKVEVYLRVKSRTVTSNKVFENLEVFFGITKGRERYIARDIEELNTYLDSLKEGKRKRITRIGKHLVDQLLLKPEEREDSQVDLFKAYEPEAEISPVKPPEVLGEVSIDYVDEEGLGIKLSPGEHKVISILQDLLHESIERNPDNKQKEKFIPELGVENVRVTTYNDYGGQIEPGNNTPNRLPAPRLSFTLYEITKRYTGGDLGGKDQAEVEAIINKLDRTRVLLNYTYTDKTQIKEKGNLRQVVTRYRDSLIKKISIELKDTKLETGEVSKTKEIIARLNPVFLHQIEKVFVLRPANIEERLSKAKRRALGKASLSNVDWLLSYELTRVLSGGNITYQIYEENLLKKVAQQYYNNKHKKTGEAKKRLAEAIETLKEEGLILGIETVKDKYIFTLNKDYLKEY